MFYTKIFGILNITPDSFSDGGAYIDANAALKRVQELIEQGADVIDIGAESTRPGAKALHYEQEIQRLENILPAASKIAKKFNKQISLDSRNYLTIKRFINDIDVINDVTGGADFDIVSLAVLHQKLLVFMHSLSVPVVKGQNINTVDIVRYLRKWQVQKVGQLKGAGLKDWQLIFDPGIGFGKTAAQCYTIIEQVKRLKLPEIKMLIGHSRKSFMNQQGHVMSVEEKDQMTLQISKKLIQSEAVDYLRVHEVLQTKRILL